MKLAVDVSKRTVADVCRAMAARSRAVDLADRPADAAALITDNADLAIAQTESGKLVLQLQPFDVNPGDAQRLAESGRCLPGHVARFRSSIAAVRRALEGGRLGEPGLLRIHCWNPEAGTASALARELDLALWLFGRLPTEVYAVERPGYRQVHLGFDGGGMAMIDLDSSVSADSDYYSLSLIGSARAAYADDHHNMNLLLGESGVRAVRVSEAETALAAMIDHFAVSVRDSIAFDPGWSETLAAQQVVEQVHAGVKQDGAVMTGGRHA